MYFITISRQIGTGGSVIAAEVAKRLDYVLVDNNSIDQKAKEMGLFQKGVEIDEKAPSLIKRLFSHQPSINLARLNSVLYEIGKEGNAVFIDHGANILLQSFECALHVLIGASKETRTRNLLQLGYDEQNVNAVIEQSDHDRGAFMRFAFGVDWNDTSLYDAILNIDKMGNEAAVEAIIALAQSEDMKSCSLKSMELLSNQALASRVYATLAEAELTYGHKSVFAVVEEEGKVRLAGIVDTETTKEEAETVARSVAGVKHIDNQIKILSRGQNTYD